MRTVFDRVRAWVDGEVLKECFPVSSDSDDDADSPRPPSTLASVVAQIGIDVGMARDKDGSCYVEGALSDVCIVSKAFEYLMICLKYDMRMDLKDIHRTVSVGIQADPLELYYGSHLEDDEMDPTSTPVIKSEAPDDYDEYDEVMAEDTEEEDIEYMGQSSDELPGDHDIEDDEADNIDDDTDDVDYSPNKKPKKKSKASPNKSPRSSSTETTPVKIPKKRGRKPKIRDPNAPPPEFKCPVEGCAYITTKRDNLRDHTRRMHEEKKLTCHICNRMYGTSKDFKRHLKAHLAMHKCDVCGKTYRNARNLKEHQEKHGENYVKPEVPCDLCDKTFCNKFVLQLHIKRIHEGINPRNFLCDYCGKAFQNRHILMEHENTHTGARPFKCKLCDACFRHSAGLRLHMKSMHNDGPERIWPCDLCDKKFRSVTGLRFHSQLHKGPPPNKCDYCEKCFYQKGARDRHMRTHTGERPYGCKLCGEKFSDNSILRRHMMGLHKEEYEKNKKTRRYLIKDTKTEEQKMLEAAQKAVTEQDQKQNDDAEEDHHEPQQPELPASQEQQRSPSFTPKKEENGDSESASPEARVHASASYGSGGSSGGVAGSAPAMLPYQGMLPWLPPFTQSFKSTIPQYLSDLAPSAASASSKAALEDEIKTEDAPSPTSMPQQVHQFPNLSNHTSGSASNMAPYLWDMFAQNMQRSYGHGVPDNESHYNMLPSRQPAFPEHIEHRSTPDTHQ